MIADPGNFRNEWRLKVRRTVQKHSTLADKIFSTVGRLSILKPLYIYTGTEHLIKWMAYDASQVPRYWSRRLQTKGED